LGDIKDDTVLIRKKSVKKFPLLEMTHYQNTWGKALASGSCVISQEMHFNTGIFSKQLCILP
jgi:hypothetical protein